VFWAAPYPGFKDALPTDVQAAFATGMRMAGERIMTWGIRGESCEDDLKAPLGMIYISRALNDDAFTKRVEDYVRPVFTDPRYLHPAGYWMERGGPEFGFGGTANLYAAWIALMTDWPFAADALTHVYRLRGHLILPEPDGKRTGPSHFNSRLGSPANLDQFHWNGARDAAAAMVTDEALHCAPTPTPDELQAAPALRAAAFAEQLRENLRDSQGHYYTTDELTVQNTMWKWVLRIWMTYNFPVSLNPGYEFYRPGTWARRQEMVRTNSPLVLSPFLRGERFVRSFADAFVVTRQAGYAAIVHTGPVGTQSPDDNKAQFPGPMGLGGGQLSAFWTPETGAVLLGLRVGMSYDRSFDVLDAWRTWPIHAVSGVGAGGRVITSARCATPETASDLGDAAATVRVSGPLVAMKVVKDPTAADPAKAKDQMYDDPIATGLTCARTFALDGQGVRVATTVSGDAKEPVTELYETLPVSLGSGEAQRTAANVTIEVRTGDAWVPASDQTHGDVRAIRITRFGRAVVVTFEDPQRVRLAPAAWEDNWLNERAACRNVLIDLGPPGNRPETKAYTRRTSYRIAADAAP
jgi:hypothetical protein